MLVVFVMGSKLTDLGVWATELSTNIVNKGSHTLVPFLVQEVQQYFMDKPLADSMLVLLASCATPRARIVIVMLSTFVPHFHTS